MKKTPNISRKTAVMAFALTATMILAPAQVTGPERGTDNNRPSSGRQPTFIPRSQQRTPEQGELPAPERSEAGQIAISFESRTANGSSSNIANPTWNGLIMIRASSEPHSNGMYRHIAHLSLSSSSHNRQLPP